LIERRFDEKWTQSFEGMPYAASRQPGPADYPNGIVGEQKNLPGFCGVALGPMSENKFGISRLRLCLL
jgi:hypothetical protein